LGGSYAIEYLTDSFLSDTLTELGKAGYLITVTPLKIISNNSTETTSPTAGKY